MLVCLSRTYSVESPEKLQTKTLLLCVTVRQVYLHWAIGLLKQFQAYFLFPIDVFHQ